jgi:hypothetical protein
MLQQKQLAALSMEQLFLLDALLEIGVCEVELGVDSHASVVPSLGNWLAEATELIKLADENLRKHSPLLMKSPDTASCHSLPVSK